MNNILFFLNSVLVGIGLAMDAFSVSVTNGLNEPDMKSKKMFLISGCFAFFQFAMPLIGWICVQTISSLFESFSILIPWIALFLLIYIGGKMLIESIHGKENENNQIILSFSVLILQGIATSIDALSVGFAIAEYNLAKALICSLIIAIVTFILCMVGIKIGKKIGKRFTKFAGILGGTILVGIGVEIFIRGLIG